MAQQKFNSAKDSNAVRAALAEALADELVGHEGTFDPLSGPKPYVVLFVGVNGSGKTTTLGKIAAKLVKSGAKVLIVAGDTFRAAAVEQLKVWAERAGADFMGRKTGADAAGLAYDSFVKAKEEGYDVVLIDTAGRLQNKQALMDELLKVVRVIKKVDPGRAARDPAGARCHGGPQCAQPGTDFRPSGLCLRAGHDQARRHGARRHPDPDRQGLRRPDQADRRRRGYRGPARFQGARFRPFDGWAGSAWRYTMTDEPKLTDEIREGDKVVDRALGMAAEKLGETNPELALKPGQPKQNYVKMAVDYGPLIAFGLTFFIC